MTVRPGALSRCPLPIVHGGAGEAVLRAVGTRPITETLIVSGLFPYDSRTQIRTYPASRLPPISDPLHPRPEPTNTMPIVTASGPMLPLVVFVVGCDRRSSPLKVLR